jgi:hypothetical protein
MGQRVRHLVLLLKLTRSTRVLGTCGSTTGFSPSTCDSGQRLSIES